LNRSPLIQLQPRKNPDITIDKSDLASESKSSSKFIIITKLLIKVINAFIFI